MTDVRYGDFPAAAKTSPLLELERFALELEDDCAMLDDLGAIEDEDGRSELDNAILELETADELDDIDGDDLTVISTSNVMCSLSEDSLMLVREMFMSSPFQKTNWLNDVTFFEPGNGSDAAALVLVSGYASSISTYMWLPSLLTS